MNSPFLENLFSRRFRRGKSEKCNRVVTGMGYDTGNNRETGEKGALNAMKTTGGETFVIKVMNNQNATWQGTVTWTDGQRTESFRSALELIKLIDSALEEGTSPGEEAEGKR